MASGLQIYLKKDSDTGVFVNFMKFSDLEYLSNFLIDRVIINYS